MLFWENNNGYCLILQGCIKTMYNDCLIDVKIKTE
jgi:hypothetical protein